MVDSGPLDEQSGQLDVHWVDSAIVEAGWRDITKLMTVLSAVEAKEQGAGARRPESTSQATALEDQQAGGTDPPEAS